MIMGDNEIRTQVFRQLEIIVGDIHESISKNDFKKAASKIDIGSGMLYLGSCLVRISDEDSYLWSLRLERGKMEVSKKDIERFRNGPR